MITKSTFRANAEITFNVKNMTCGGCAASVESMLRSLSGITDVQVDLPNKTARVNFQPDAVTVEQMKQTIHSIGYELEETAHGIQGL
jgi:Cu2+-exporting ATPase